MMVGCVAGAFRTGPTLCMVAASMRAVLGLVLLVILAAIAFTPAFYLAFAQWTDTLQSKPISAYASACEVKSALDYCDVTGDKYGDWLRTFNSVLSMAVSVSRGIEQHVAVCWNCFRFLIGLLPLDYGLL